MNNETSLYTISVLELKDMNFDFGLKDYTIFDEAYRPILNDAIMNFYMFREIGFVNPIEFQFRLNARLNLIMRNKYNAMYVAKAVDFNPLYTMDLFEDSSHTTSNDTTTSINGETNYNTSTNNKVTNTAHNSSNNGEYTTNGGGTTASNTGTTTTDNNSLALWSQFPSEELTNDDLTSNLYVDSASKNTIGNTVTDATTQTNLNNQTSTITGTSDTNNTLDSNTDNTGTDKATNTNAGTTNNNTTDTFSKHTIGSASDLTFAHAMTQFKDYLDVFQIDQQVIGELKDLFMQVW
jgi:hypothetical protein